MDFTREPIIETVITPKEGCKLVVRSSKSVGQEEYFVDAVEVVTFGSAIFFRSTERPKPFIVPASDYEVLEVREARIVLKNVGSDRSIKIAGGRESHPKIAKEIVEEKLETAEAVPETADKGDARNDRKRDRRRQSRRRRGRDEINTEVQGSETEQRIDLPAPHVPLPLASEITTSPLLSSLLAPPPLISETISRYKEQFKDAFYAKEAQDVDVQLEAKLTEENELQFEPPAIGSFDISEENEEEIYRERRRYVSDKASSQSFEDQPEEGAFPEKREDT